MRKILSLLVLGVLLLTNTAIGFADTNYTVKQSDMLWKIAAQHDMKWEDLAKLNNMKNPNRIYPGQVIQVKGEMEMANKDKVVALLKSIETGDMGPIAYVNPEKYIQHNLMVGDGLEGFGEALSHLPEGSARVNTVRAFEDGDYVFTHTDYDFFGPKIGFDVFRFEDGLIVEHWDNLNTTASEPNPSGRTEIDGPTAVQDLDKTAENKELVENFVNDILINDKMEKLAQYFDGDSYIQHNANVADGLSGLGAAIEEMTKQGMTMRYDKVHKILGQGNFVLVMSEGEFAGKDASYYDLFRVENGKIAEHWDVVEEILTEDARMNDNGKF